MQWNFPCLSGSDAPAAHHPNRSPRIIHIKGSVVSAIALYAPFTPLDPPRAPDEGTPISEGWSRFFCARENAYYFFHPRTGVTQWETPTPSQSLLPVELDHPVIRCFQPECNSRPFWSVCGLHDGTPFQLTSPRTPTAETWKPRKLAIQSQMGEWTYDLRRAVI